MLPHSPEAERTIGGAVLLDPTVIKRLRPILRPSDLYVPPIAAVVEAAFTLDDAGKPIDPITVADEMRRIGTFKALRAHNDEAFLAGLSASVVTLENLEYHARKVAEWARVRRATETADGIAEAGYTASDPDEFFALNQQALRDLDVGAILPTIAPAATTGAAWPAPLGLTALHGLAGEVVRAIEPHSEADPAALLVQFLVAFGSAIGRNAHAVAEADRHGCNLFAVLVGETSKGRKGTSWGIIRRLFGAVDQAHVDAASVFGVRVLPIKLPGRTGPLSDCAAARVTALDVERLRDALMADGYAANSVRHTLRSLSRLYTWDRRVGAIDCDNPVSGIERPAAVATVDYLDAGEVARLLAHAGEAPCSALGDAAISAEAVGRMIAVAVYAGLRKGELFGLRWRDLDVGAGRLSVARSYTLLPKSGKIRHVPINAELAPALRRWRERCPATDDGLVFPVARESGKGWRMGRADDDLGLPALLAGARCHTPADGRPWHLLRHTFASHFIMGGGNILSLQKLLGHSDLKMTLIYAHLAPDFMQAEIGRMSFAQSPGANVVPLDAARGRDG